MFFICCTLNKMLSDELNQIFGRLTHFINGKYTGLSSYLKLLMMTIYLLTTVDFSVILEPKLFYGRPVCKMTVQYVA